MCVYSTLAEQGEGSFGSFQSTLIDTVAYYAAFQAHEWLTVHLHLPLITTERLSIIS